MSTDAAVGPGGVIATDPIPVDLASVDTVLTSLWKRQEVAPGSKQGVLTRACMSNLIVVCQGPEQTAIVESEVDEIVGRHPCRVILLAFDVPLAEGSTGLEAAVSAHCHLIGDHRQVCSEMVRIVAAGEQVRKLPSAARSLVVGDLPTSLWWNTPLPPPLGGPLFEELRVMSDQVIYSSLQWADAVNGTLAAAGWVESSRPGDPVVMDIAWRALRPWRQLIGQSLDPVANPGALDELTEVQIEHGPHGLPQAWLLAGWIASALGWVPLESSVAWGKQIAWRFRTAKGQVELCVRRLEEGEPQVRRVQTSWKRDGRCASITFAPAGPNHLSAAAEGFDAETRMLTLPRLTRGLLVAAELQQLEPDPVFQAALLISQDLAANFSR